jgi:methionyl-tRNA synthetase
MEPSASPSPRAIESEFAYTKPGPLYVDINTNILLGWQVVPGTEDVRKLDLRIGVIRHAEPVPKSQKLLKLKVDVGLEERTIVAGIGESYQPENLVGRHVVVVVNLQSATLMGVESQGILLAAKQTGELELLSVESCRPGSKVS